MPVRALFDTFSCKKKSDNQPMEANLVETSFIQAQSCFLDPLPLRRHGGRAVPAGGGGAGDHAPAGAGGVVKKKRGLGEKK